MDGFALQLGNFRYIRSGGNTKNVGAVKKMAVKERVVQSRKRDLYWKCEYNQGYGYWIIF